MIVIMFGPLCTEAEPNPKKDLTRALHVGRSLLEG